MKQIGGKSHIWRGEDIRTIQYQGFSCATMPRKSSTIVYKDRMRPNSCYNIIIEASNKSGNGKLEIGFNDIKQCIYINSRIFNKFKMTLNSGIASSDIVISRPQDASGTVVIRNISYDEIEKPKVEEEIELEVESKKEELNLEIQKKFSSIQAEKDRKYRKEKTREILEKRGDLMGEPIIIGGKGYRWKGKKIRTIYKHNTTCVLLQGVSSMILAPVSIFPKKVFNIIIDASGSGTLMVNFFGGQKYDGPQTRIDVNNKYSRKYSIDISSPDFPQNNQMYLRAWVPSSGGNISIKTITYVKTNKKKKPIYISPTLQRQKTEEPTKKNRTKMKEIYEMRFKPYIINNKTPEKIKQVLIGNKDQVPKVSIITPTRDGVDLLRNCYTALDQNTAYPNWEWIVGDSDSKDDTSEFMKSLDDPRVIFVERGTTSGSFSSINNELVEYATGDYYLFLNNDTEPQPFWLYEMMSKIHKNDGIGVVGAKLMYNKNRIQHAGIMFMPEGPGNVGEDLLKSLGGNKFAIKDRFYQAVTGACLLISSDDFKKIGGFDPSYYFCYEDIDLCLKVVYNLNKKVLYAARAVVLHKESATQKKYKTGGERQRAGIKIFKERWAKKVRHDIVIFMRNRDYGINDIDISFVTCVNNVQQYSNYIVGSLFLSNTKKNYEFIPILNNENKYSAAQALNLGINMSRGNIIVMCHQDVVFYEDWVDLLYDRIKAINNNEWGVLGTAGITKKDKTMGVVYNLKGRMQWRQNVRLAVAEVQTVDEHCMIIRKGSKLKFDEATFDGFHCYGPDICLNALSKGMKNYGILCPLIHDSGSGSLKSGKMEFMRLLQALSNKWSKKFNKIRTTTSNIRNGKIETFIKF